MGKAKQFSKRNHASRNLFCFFCAFLIAFGVLTDNTYADNRELIVFIASDSESAYRYHLTEDCPSLSRSIVSEVTLEYAARCGFTACDRCHPPAPDFEVVATPRPVSLSTNTNGEKSRFATKSIENNQSNSWKIWLCIIATIMTIALVYIVIGRIRSNKYNRERDMIERQEREKWAQERQKYKVLYEGKPTLELCGAPSNCYVGEDGLPACKSGDETWGTDYTVYVTITGKAYHNKNCPIAINKYAYPINAYKAKMKGFCMCSYCRTELPDMTWYQDYLTIAKIRQKYMIEE